MTSQTTERPAGRTTTIPVTTLEELPVLEDKERDELIASLREAEAQIKAGEGVEYDSAAFKARLKGIYRASWKRAQAMS